MAAAGLKAAFAILCRWECSALQQATILGFSKSSYYKYRRTPEKACLNDAQIERLSFILNIHASLRTLFENPANVYGFMQMPNKNGPFKGQTPLSYISDGHSRSLRSTMHYLIAIQENPCYRASASHSTIG